MNRHAKQTTPQREDFPDGSALVTYPGGSMLILESKFSKVAVVRENKSANYNDPPPPPRTAEP